MDHDMDVYQTLAERTARYQDAGTGYPRALAYAGLGLAGEAGEVANKIKKVLRDHGGRVTPEMQAALADELGDVLWYVARLCSELSLSMGHVAEHNLSMRGVLGGSGDAR